MKIISVPTIEPFMFTCAKCCTEAEAEECDIQKDEFKISGYHFAGTAVCRERRFVSCPTCGKLFFLD